VDFLLPAGSQKCEQEIPLHQGFPTGKGRPAAGFVVEGDVPLYLRHHLRDRHLSASHLARFGVADFDASPAACASFPIDRYAPGIPGGRPLCAHGYASAASDAPIWPEHQFRFRGLALRVVTPPTTQGTTFEEDGRADAWAIVNGEFFDVKDSPFDQNRCFSCVDRPDIQKTPSSGGHCPFECMFWAWL
jgi:hypothetical protein